LAQIPIPSALSALTDFYFKPLSQFVVDPYRQIRRRPTGEGRQRSPTDEERCRPTGSALPLQRVGEGRRKNFGENFEKNEGRGRPWLADRETS
jgi:hypothetical protein